MVPPAEILGAMITPAILISSCGTLIISTSNRLSRSVERIRDLSAEVLALDPEVSTKTIEGRKFFIVEQLGHISARVLMLRKAMTTLYSAIGLLVLTSIAVGLSAIADWKYGWVPVVTGLMGSFLLLLGSLLLVREARLAVHSTLEEMSEIQRGITARGGR